MDKESLRQIESYKPMAFFPPAAREVFCLGAFRSLDGVSLILFSLAPVDTDPDVGLPLCQQDEFRVWDSFRVANSADYRAITVATQEMIEKLLKIGTIKGYRNIILYSNFNISLRHFMIAGLQREAKSRYRLTIKQTQLLDLDDAFFTLNNLVLTNRLKVSPSEAGLVKAIEGLPNLNPGLLNELSFHRSGEYIFCLLHSIALYEAWLIKNKIATSRARAQREQY